MGVAQLQSEGSTPGMGVLAQMTVLCFQGMCVCECMCEGGGVGTRPWW